MPTLSLAPARLTPVAGISTDYEVLLTDFVPGSSALQPEHEEWLAELGRRCLRHEAHAGFCLWGVTAVGYGSQSGSRALNLTLSIARARTVVDFYTSLIDRPHAYKVKILGLGKDYPADPKNKENGRDRCVHIGVGPNEMLAPAAPKAIDFDLIKIAREEGLRRHKVQVVVDAASETGVGISKFLIGAGYSTIRLNFTITDLRSRRSFKFTFTGSGLNVGATLNPLDLDMMRTVGKGKPSEIYVHDTLDVAKHFLGKATIDMIADGVYLTYRGRIGYHRAIFELNMPTQIQAPSFNLIKRFDGSVRAGHRH